MLAARARLVQTRPVSLASSWARSFSLSAPLAAPPPVIGSGPAYPRHLLIHANQPATSWPSHLEAVSPLYRQLGKRFAAHPGLAKLGFSFTDAGNEPVEKQWDATRSKFDEPREGGGEECVRSSLPRSLRKELLRPAWRDTSHECAHDMS